MSQIPPTAVKPSIVPKIGDEPWAREVFATWTANPDVAATVKRAIKQKAV